MNNFQLFNASEFLMNTRFEMVVWGIDSKISERAFKAAVEKIKQLELILSFYHQNSETYALNKSAFNKATKVKSVLWNYLVQAKHYANVTHSYFNAALGNVYNAVKNKAKLDLAVPSEFTDLVTLNVENYTVRFLNASTAIDFGGMGKGIALKETKDILQKYGIENVFISFGESSILTKGRHPHGHYWPFSLMETNHDFELELNNDCISISNAKQTVNNDKNLHIVNPKSINSSASDVTVIVQSDNAIDAEVLSTALVAAPKEKHQAIIENFPSAKVYLQ